MDLRVNRALVDRDLHPAVWWIWTALVAFAITRSNNYLYAVTAIAAAAWVVAHFRQSAPWSRAFSVALTIATAVFGIRLAIGLLFGVPTPGNALFTIRQIQLPSWFAGIRLGGPVTSERLGAVISEGAAIVALIAVIGAATALTNPRRLLHILPGALHEAGVAVVVATTFTPQLVMSARRVQEARRLRGHNLRGFGALRGLIRPVLDDAMDRALALACAMESRGYGRRVDTHTRRGPLFLLAGLTALGVATFGLLAVESVRELALALFIVGFAAAMYALRLASAKNPRSTYRPDRWGGLEWLIISPAMLSATALVVLRWDAQTSYSVSLLPATQLVPLALFVLPALPVFFLRKEHP